MVEFRFDTPRLTLREWTAGDADQMHAIGSDPRVMAYLGPLSDREEAKNLVAGQIVNQRLFGHCFWAVERRENCRLIGLCGLNPGPADTPLAGGLEIAGWLAFDAWGQGYAYEAGVASLDWAWQHTDAPFVAAMTAPANYRSRRLMEQLGMTRRAAEDFDQPALPTDDPLRRQHVYRIARPA